MIAWGIPAAFAGLLLLAGPILVHMLLRRNARRVVFPTSRFFVATRAASVRFQRPSDIGLLILRSAAVAAAVFAAAQPIVLGAWRTRAWNERVARAVVLDTSRSMPASGAGGRLADQEMNSFASARFEGNDLRDAIRRASGWLEGAPPARREIVVISDFQRGAIDEEALRTIPAGVGLRFTRAATHPAERSVPLPATSGWRGSEWQPAATIRGEAIDASWTRRGPSAPAWIETRQPAGDEHAARRAVEGAASPGIAPPPESRRAIVRFSGAAPEAGERPITTEWMLRAELALRQSRLLRQTGASISTAEQGTSLVVHANVAAPDPMAAAIVRAVMLAVSPATVADPELEIATMPDAQLAAWRREPAPVDRVTAVPRGVESDARWLWAVALVLLGIEAWVRRRRGDQQAAAEDARAHAA